MAVYGGGGSRRVNRHVILGIICLLAGQTQQHVVRDGQVSVQSPNQNTPFNSRAYITAVLNQWSNFFIFLRISTQKHTYFCNFQ